MAVGNWGGERGMIVELLTAGAIRYRLEVDRAILALFGAHAVDDPQSPGLLQLARALTSRANDAVFLVMLDAIDLDQCGA